MTWTFSTPPPTITLGQWPQNSILACPWLHGVTPKDITPKIFKSSKRKNWSVNQALVGDAWIHNVNLENNFTLEHLTQLVELWILPQEVHHDENVEHTVYWKLTSNGNIPQPRHTSFNSLDLSIRAWTKSFVKRGHLQRLNTMHGCILK
jgi:hypothetical protein